MATPRQKELQAVEEIIAGTNVKPPTKPHNLPDHYKEMVTLCKDSTLTDEQYYEVVRQKAKEYSNLLDDMSEEDKKYLDYQAKYDFWALAYYNMIGRRPHEK